VRSIISTSVVGSPFSSGTRGGGGIVVLAL